MRKFFKIVGVIFAIFIAAFVVIMFLTKDLANTAEEFFRAIKSSDYQKAYFYLSKDFQAVTTPQQLKKFIEANRLNQYKEIEWGNRSISGKKGEIEGSLITQDNNAIPIKLFLVKAKDSWKIYGIKKPKAGIEETPLDNQIAMPSVETIYKLIKEATDVFVNSLKNGDFSILYNWCASSCKNEYSLDDISKIFKRFIPIRDLFIEAASQKPILLETPKIDIKGVLNLKGYYDVGYSKLFFEYEFMKENGKWRLSGILYKIKPKDKK